jgi:hypothetical protein
LQGNSLCHLLLTGMDREKAKTGEENMKILFFELSIVGFIQVWEQKLNGAGHLAV